MRLIDADAFKKYLDDCDCCKNCTDYAKRMYICYDCPLPDCCDYRWERIINEQPTVDAIPISFIEELKAWAKENGSAEYADDLTYLLNAWAERKEECGHQ